MSDKMQPSAFSVGTWPLAPGTYDPALDGVCIPNGAVIFGLFDEDFTKYDAPESIPGLAKVSSPGELTDNTYFVLNASSGFDYILVKADAGDLSVKMVKEKTAINAFLDHKEENTPNIALVKELYMGTAFNTVNGTFNKAAVSRILVDNPTWHVCPGFPDGGTYSGMDEVFGSFYANVPNHYCLFYGEPEVLLMPEMLLLYSVFIISRLRRAIPSSVPVFLTHLKLLRTAALKEYGRLLILMLFRNA